MKKNLFNSFLLMIVLFPFYIQAQSSGGYTDEQLACADRTLRAFYAEYDGRLGPEPVRRAKFNDYINCVNPSLSKKDRDNAFRIVDAYIRGDGGGLLSEDKKLEIRQQLLRLEEQYRRDTTRGMQALNEQLGRIKQMSYGEYAAYVREMNPGFTDSQIARSYNRLHQSDGRSVKVPEENPDEMNQMKAIDIASHPEKYDYPTFRKAFLMLDPNIKEDELRKVWESTRKNN